MAVQMALLATALAQSEHARPAVAAAVASWTLTQIRGCCVAPIPPPQLAQQRQEHQPEVLGGESQLQAAELEERHE